MANDYELEKLPNESQETWLKRLRDIGLKRAKQTLPPGIVSSEEKAKIDKRPATTPEKELSILKKEQAIAQENLSRALENGGGFSERTQLDVINSKIKKLEKTAKFANEPVENLKTEPSTTKGSPDNTESTVDVSSATTRDTQINAVPLINELHQYPSYTYGLSLHLLTSTEYNNVVDTGEYKANRVLIASAGRYNDTPGEKQFIRSKYFDKDYFFENLDMSTIIGANESNRNTNAIILSFNIIEPYGMTLLDNIIKLCSDESVKSENWIDMPYLLRIDFYASNDAGELTGIIPGITKNIPIRLLKMDIKAGAEGSRYDFQAVPFGQSAFDQSRGTTPIGLEVTASTVAGFFSSAKASDETFIEERESRQGVTTTFNGQSSIIPKLLVSDSAISEYEKDNINRVKSFGSAINAHYKDLVKKNKIKFRDKYYFKFADEIGKSQFTLTNKITPKDTRMADVEDSVSIRKANYGESSDELDFNLRIFSVNAGTTIDAVLDYVMRNSDYIQSQMVVPEEYTDPAKYQQDKEQNKNKPLKWFKIIPTVKITEYDSITKVWARDITYNVVPYTIYNTKIDVTPQGTAQYPLKVYNYLYSGQNTDILDFNIEFNALFYTAVTAHRENMNQPNAESANPQNDSNTKNFNGQQTEPNAIQPIGTKAQTQTRHVATGGATNSRAIATADTAQSLYTSAGADMIQLNLKIVGDPQFIKQDDVFYSSDLTNGTKADLPAIGTDPRLTKNGSILTDRGEIYIQILFKTPSDINEDIGLMDFTKSEISVFSGMYKVIKVDSEFRDGNFTQRLDVVRLPRQEYYDYLNKTENTTDERETNSAVQLPTTEVANNSKEVVLESTEGERARDAIVLSPDQPVLDDQESLRKDSKNFPTLLISKSTESQAVVNQLKREIKAGENVTVNNRVILGRGNN